MYREIFLLTAFLAVAFSKPNRIRIVGGKQLVFREYPSLVAIFMKKSDKIICGGALITHQHAASAAHCFLGDIKPNDIYLIAGEKNLLRPPNTRRKLLVKEIISHPEYQADQHINDYAILVLTEPIEKNEHIKTVKLSKQRPAPGAKCIVTGWDRLESGRSKSEQAMKADVYVLTREQCHKLKGIDDASMFCAGVPEGESGDACKGDSNGPLFCNDELAGIVSWGRTCALPEYPGVYADVSAQRKWFTQLIATTSSLLGKGTNQNSV